MIIPPFLFRPHTDDDFTMTDWQDVAALIIGIVLGLGFIAILVAVAVRTLE